MTRNITEKKETTEYNDNVAVVFLYMIMAYQLLGLYRMVNAAFDAINGVSGTEFTGLVVMIFILVPSFILLTAYSILLLFKGYKLTKKAIRRRKIALYLNYLILIVVFYSPLIVGSIFY